MTHPTPEELAAFLYQELAPAQQTEIAGHVDACSECRTQLAAWRSAQKELQTWRLPESRLPHIAPSPLSNTPRIIRWGGWTAAASLFLVAGFVLARLTAPTPDLSTLRQQLSVEFARYTAAQTARDQDFQQSLTQTVQQLATRQTIDQVSLRKDVETVALHTQEEFTRLASAENSNTNGNN
jgi:hypothetical protein